MRLEYDNGVIRIENGEGRRWQLNNAKKPTLSFQFDALLVSPEQALRRLGSSVKPLTQNEQKEVVDFIQKQRPPPFATLQRQLTSDLKLLCHGLISTVVTQLEYDSLLDVQIAGRNDSTDLFAAEARRVLSYVDSIWNAFHGLSAQISATPEQELRPLKFYANMMPMAPSPEFFSGASTDVQGERPNETLPPDVSPPVDTSARSYTAAQAANAANSDGSPTANGHGVARVVTLEHPDPVAADLSNVLNRVLVFDDFFPTAQLHLLQKWAVQSPHWMLTNSSYNEKGIARHRIWGASYIEAWDRGKWAGLPPILFSTIAAIFQKLNVTIASPRYIGLNGQLRGQDASTHIDCEPDATDELSILVYIGEETDGDLILYDKDDRQRELNRISFRSNRVIAFDGSIPHQALAPTDDKFRISLVVRGKYQAGDVDVISTF